ncbi:MAG: hypothetical protein WCF04_07820 [Candidatus Nanopelagicales bacterium]
MWRSVVRRYPRIFLPLVGAQLVAVGVLRLAVDWVNRPQPSADLTDVTGAAAGPLAWAVNAVLVVLITAAIAAVATLAIGRTHRLAGPISAEDEAAGTGPQARGLVILLAAIWGLLIFWPLALLLLAGWALAAPWAVGSGGSVRQALAASTRLAKGRRSSTAGLVAGITFIVALGPVVGTVLLLVTDLPHFVAWLTAATLMALATAWGGVALALGMYTAEASHARAEGLPVG